MFIYRQYCSIKVLTERIHKKRKLHFMELLQLYGTHIEF